MNLIKIDDSNGESLKIYHKLRDNAFSPSWWEKLSKDNQDEISKSITNMMQLTIAIREYYLMNRLTDISNWNFRTVNDNINVSE
ncbi:MAG: hypothetical protein L3J19_01945 [Sulfurimonas sp.]|nr:hypothetical protein [Sulfurimonas sp.]